MPRGLVPAPVHRRRRWWRRRQCSTNVPPTLTLHIRTVPVSKRVEREESSLHDFERTHPALARTGLERIRGTPIGTRRYLAVEQVYCGVFFMQQHSHNDATTEFLTLVVSWNVLTLSRHMGEAASQGPGGRL